MSLYLQLESEPIEGSDFSKVRLYRLDSNPNTNYEGTLISTVAIQNEYVHGMFWCGASLRIILADLLGNANLRPSLLDRES